MSWQQVVALLVTVAPVFAWAGIARRARQTPGRHRTGRIAAPVYVLDRARAAVPPPPDPEPLDDWTSYLPTEELPVITGQRWLPSEHRKHTSPSERARQRWGVECPIFAGLADEWGYEPARGLDGFDARRCAA